MNIDHIFIFTDDHGKIADELVNFGLTEGSNRVHAGQGTTNRKFYFENFFLEVLWVHNETELTSGQTASTGLWRRADFKTHQFSPFGLCLVNEADTDSLFEKAYKYQPDYFPKGMEIDILKNEEHPGLPWTFRLPFKGRKKHEQEPVTHRNGIAILTKAVFEFNSTAENSFVETLNGQNSLQFVQTSRCWLNLVFDHGKQGKRKDFDKLFLTIEY